MNRSDVTRLEPLPPELWHVSLDPVIRDMRGRPLNIHRMLAHHPDLLAAWWPFRNYSVKGGALSARDRELVILRVAYALRSPYEWDSHVERGYAAGLSLEEIDRVRQGATADGWSESESVLLAAVDDCLEARCIKPDTLQRFSRFYSNKQALDVIAIHSLYVMLGVIIATWGLELDEFIELPEGYQAPSEGK
ncbi:MAG TPA: carboxymuconolactone decarboxylase family protein [Xanthomonadales bacterium]|nr:carboxymuconolactone decarboxylase family protein [Xanthomonadales bacterium]